MNFIELDSCTVESFGVYGLELRGIDAIQKIRFWQLIELPGK